MGLLELAIWSNADHSFPSLDLSFCIIYYNILTQPLVIIGMIFV